MRLARLNSDGSLDPTFDPALENIPGENPADPNYPAGAVYAMTVQPDGRILVGGEFQAVNGVPGIRFARLNQDGSLDQSLDTIGSIPSGDAVQSIAQLEDGSVVLGGSFSNFAFPDWRPSSAYPPLRRLTRDGHRDDGFEKRLTQGFLVSAVWTLPNGDLLAGGQFDTNFYDSIPSRALVAQFRPDGSLVRWNPLGAEGAVQVVLATADGRLLIGGNFESALGKHGAAPCSAVFHGVARSLGTREQIAGFDWRLRGIG